MGLNTLKGHIENTNTFSEKIQIFCNVFQIQIFVECVCYVRHINQIHAAEQYLFLKSYRLTVLKCYNCGHKSTQMSLY